MQTNPLYVEREIEVQMKDSGAETIVALDLFFPRIKNILANTNLKGYYYRRKGLSSTFIKTALSPIETCFRKAVDKR